VLAESASSAFRFDHEGIGWRDHFISTSDLAATRQTLFYSFGSCSVQEPIDDLRRIGAL
jgi:hypothetical protein